MKYELKKIQNSNLKMQNDNLKLKISKFKRLSLRGAERRSNLKNEFRILNKF